MTMGSAKGGEDSSLLAASFVLASTSFVLAYASFDISM